MEDRIETAQGEIAGTRQDGVSRFLGIPYAAPVGPRRVRPPEPPRPGRTENDPAADRRELWEGLR